MSDPKEREHQQKLDDELELDIEAVQDLEIDPESESGIHGGGCVIAVSRPTV